MKYVQVSGQVVFWLEQSWLFCGVLLAELLTPNRSFMLCVLLWCFLFRLRYEISFILVSVLWSFENGMELCEKIVRDLY